MRVPAAVLRPGLGVLRRTVFNADVPLHRQRRRQERMVRLTMRVPRSTAQETVSVGGVSCLRLAAPGLSTDRTVVHLHGGGFCIGSPTMVRSYAAALSAATRAAVLVPDFRLAPEHPYPAALDDLMTVWGAVSQDETARVVLTADSAGAALALACTVRLRDAGRHGPAALGLVSPWLDLATPRTDGARDPLLSPGWLASCARAYADGHPVADPDLSPLHADLHGLPPTLIVSASHELLAEDARRLTDALRAAGGVVEHHQEDLWHDFALQAGLLAEADSFVDRLGSFLGPVWT